MNFNVSIAVGVTMKYKMVFGERQSYKTKLGGFSVKIFVLCNNLCENVNTSMTNLILVVACG